MKSVGNFRLRDSHAIDDLGEIIWSINFIRPKQGCFRFLWHFALHEAKAGQHNNDSQIRLCSLK